MVLTASLHAPPGSPGAEPQTAVGPNAGVVLRYGNWSHTLGPGCYQPDSLWSPGPPPPTVYISVRFANVSAEAYREACASSVPVLVNVHSEKTYAPVPGGCSTTGQTENDPSLALDFDDEETSVGFQQGDVGMPRSFYGAEPHGCSCDFIQVNEEESGGTLSYEVYRGFVADCGSKLHGAQQDVDSLYTLLKRMSTVAGVKQYGTKHPQAALLPSYNKLVLLDSQPGQVRRTAGFLGFGAGKVGERGSECFPSFLLTNRADPTILSNPLLPSGRRLQCAGHRHVQTSAESVRPH